MLKPNCLLTRYPICFVHGLKNIFVAVNYWGGIPEHLKDHGYDTHEFFAPWRGPHKARVDTFSQQFERVLKKSEKVHAVAHSLGTLDMLDILNLPQFRNKFSSVTLVSPPFAGTPLAQFGLAFGKDFFKTNETLTIEGATQIVQRFKKPDDVLLGAIISKPKQSDVSLALRIQHEILNTYLRLKKLPEDNDGLIPLTSQYVAKRLGPIFLEYAGDHMQVIGRGKKTTEDLDARGIFLKHAIFLAEHDFKTAQ